MAIHVIKMKILLFGKNGQLGQEIMAASSKFKYNLIAYGHDEVEIVNYSQVIDCIQKNKPDIIINATAYHVVNDCELYPEKAFAVNAIALKNLAELCNKNKIKLVHYSSDYVFDGTKGGPYQEDDTPNPLQIYGVSKLAGEKICLNYHDDSLIIRTCGVYGGKTGSRAKKGNFVLSILKQTEGKKELEVSNEQIVSPTYAHDLAEGTFKLISKKPSHSIYHLVNEGHCSWAEFASEIMKLAKRKCRIISINRSGQYQGTKKPLFSALSNKKAKSLGVILPTWKEALKNYLFFRKR